MWGIDGDLVVGERGEWGIRAHDERSNQEDGSKYTALRQQSAKKRHSFRVRTPASGPEAGFQLGE